MTTQHPFRGIFTIPSTPFKQNGEIDIVSFQRVVDFCVDCGAHGLVYPVNASEFTSLSDCERKQLSQILVEQNDGRIPAIIGVAAVAQEVAADFARHARDIGADGVIAMPPYIKRGSLSDDQILSYYQVISDAAQLPIFVQNYSPPIGTDMSAELLLRLCKEIEFVRYVKEETLPSTVKLSNLLHLNDGSCLGVFGGAGGRYLIEEYRRRSAGNMPGCHITDVVVAFWKALEAGHSDTAMEIYKAMAPLFFFEHQLSGCYKEVLYRRGVIDCALKRNGKMPLDEIASTYLDEILDSLKTYMQWHK
ncbi:MAG: dihydrodipicolinate synthase family protein [Anaerolineae bacterium]|nr:dihydrodipicolinate synthase family protein [Anaerolineae bacterium]